MIVGMKRLGFVLYSPHAVHVCEFKKHSLVTSALCWQIIQRKDLNFCPLYSSFKRKNEII